MKKVKHFIQPETVRFTPAISSGLSCDQVKQRTEEGLVNSVSEKYSKSYLSIFAENIFTFFNLLGLIVCVALIVAGAGLFDFVFVLVFITNIVIGIIQEIRAKKCIDRLSILSCKKSVAIRDGAETEVSPFDIVLDDIIKLSIGDQIPTDSVIIDGNAEVDESVLTGESIPVKKNVGDSVLSGSFIISGNCFIKAERVGKDNYVQKLSAQAKKYKKPHSELMESLKLMIKILGFIIIPIAAAYMVKSAVIQNVELKESILRTSTLVIGMIPSGMFLLTSLALAVGIIKLAGHNTLVQDLYSLEMLARVDTICFDKTGTITDGKMAVKEIVPLKDTSQMELKNIMSSFIGSVNDNNQTAIALKDYFGSEIKTRASAVVAFNSKRKFSAATFYGIGTYALGAPEFVLNKKVFSELECYINKYAALGLRVLMLAKSKNAIEDDTIPNDFMPEALILLMDNVRKEAISTVRWFNQNDVEIKVISGDNPITVSEVSARVGIKNANNFISLEGLSDEEVQASATKYTVFGRVSPEQKAILVKSLKDAGHMTAMTGDGVNDVLALKEADCAVSVASGSDAARNIAHIVLLDDNFDSMPNIVFEGRRVINNVKRSSTLYLMKTFFTLLLAIITLALPFVEKYPFELKQMNLLEVLIIGIPSFFLSLQPNKSIVSGKFINYVIKKSLPSAVLMVLSVGFVQLLKTLTNYFPNDFYRTLSVYALTFSGLVNLAIICLPFNKYRFVLFAICAILLVAAFVITVFNGISFLGFVKLSPLSNTWHHLLYLLGIILLDIPLSLLLQKLFGVLFKIKSKK